MGINDLQNRLIQQIKDVNDPALLNALHTILISASNDAKYALSNSQKKSIRKSRQEAKNGQLTDHETFMSEIKSWIKEK